MASAKAPAPAFDAESLAIFLALSSGGRSDDMTRRPQLQQAWDEMDEEYRAAYRRRAQRLMRIWRSP